MIARRSWSKRWLKLRQTSASCPPLLSETWISAARKATVPLPCPSLRFPLLGTLKTSFLRRRLWPQTSPHIPRGLKMAIPPTRKLGRRRRRSSVTETLSKLARTLPLPPVLTCLAPRLILSAKTLPWLPATTATRRVTMRTTVLSPGRMRQKTSNSLGDLYVGDWR